MKALRIIAGIIIILAVVVLVGGIFLPSVYSVSRSTQINAPDSVIYRNIADFNEFRTWNPWAKMDPNAKITVSGQPAKPGHTYAWTGEKMGSGEMKISAAMPNKLTAIDLKFIKPFASESDTRFELVPSGAATKVTWTMSGENEGIFGKWMSLMMDGMVGKDFDSGLAALKAKSEAQQP